MKKVIFARKAEVDFVAIQRETMEEFGYHALLNFERRFNTLLSSVSSFPDSCAAVKSLGNGIRRGVVFPYSIFYRYDPSVSRVVILRILHGRPKITRNMLRDT